MHKPIHLYGLPQIAGRMGGHMMADAGYLLQFLPALRVVLPGGHLFSKPGMALGEQNGGIARDGHGLQLLLLVGGLGVIDVIQRGYLFFYAGLDVEQSLTVHLSIHSRMPGGTLLHELGEDAGVVGLFPFLRHVVEDALALRLSLPIGYDLALVDINILLTDGIALQLALVQRMQVFH